MGLHLPGASFVNPGHPAARRPDPRRGRGAPWRSPRTGWPSPPRSGEVVDEKAVVNACVALLATGGSTNHTMHLVAIAAAAGIALTWDDLSDLSAACRCWPGSTPTAPPTSTTSTPPAGSPSWCARCWRRAAARRRPHGGRPRPVALHRASPPAPATVSWSGRTARRPAWTPTSCARCEDPFAPDGGLRDARGSPRPRRDQDLRGPAGAPASSRPRRWSSTTRPTSWPPSTAGALDGRDLVAVLRYQGPRRQRHARAAQADPGARGAPGPRAAGRRRHRRPDVRRLRQGPGRDPRHARGRRTAGRSPGCATATSSPLDAERRRPAS